VRSSPFRSAAYSLRCKIEKFEAIIFPHRSRRRCLRTANRRAPVPEAAAVQPKCAKSSSGAHAQLFRAKADTPRCSAISTSYCRRPRPASCTTSRCHRRQHRHCLCRARWCIDRPPHRAHPRRRADIIVSLFLMKKALIPERKKASRFPRPVSIARNALQAVGFHTQEISSRIPFIYKRRPMSPWPHTRRMVKKYYVGCRGQPWATPRLH
jgi:hypothetical protein